MPKIARYSLVWSPYRQTYEWRESPGSGVQDVATESPILLEWVGQVSSFAFHGRNGSYTMYKEHKQRGEGYWYAYVRVNGKRAKRYLGRDCNLTLTRLEQVAHELRQDMPDMPQQYGNDRIDQKARHRLSALSTDLLLATKLDVPIPRSRLVHRLRLIQQLQQGMDRALTLISAPIGFGKSTLLSVWLTSRTIRAAWLSLEPQDNEPTRFISYLLAALQTNAPHLVVTRQAVVHPLHSSSIEAVLTLLINDLQRRTAAQDHMVLVLDNYQVITDVSIHQALSFLLEHLPPWMHLVLATREDPPLPLARLRGRDDLLELRAADLRFTQEEAASFLIEVMKLPLSQEECALLHARTEGWITGLQLAALSLQGRDDSRAFIMAFSGSHHYVMDYLIEEVLKRQSAAIQDFLLQTCILDRLCAPLCDAVREQNGSQTLLDYLERANLFLVALDDAGQWYRYHRLFAEALRQQLQQTAPALVAELHLRASRWDSQQGLHGEIAALMWAAPVFPSDPLTTREHEVLQLLLNGASNREIAHHLVLSMNTVKRHVLNICRKFDVRSRAQVVAKMRIPHLH
jgi:LuxR family transcriptional regulator, maltose regulon positive regulatory protein